MMQRRDSAKLAITLILLVQFLACAWSPEKQAFSTPSTRHQLDHLAVIPDLDHTCRNINSGGNGTFGDDENKPSLPKSQLTSNYTVCCSIKQIETSAIVTGHNRRWLLLQSLLI